MPLGSDLSTARSPIGPRTQSAFGILLEHPLPVAVDYPFERGVIRASRNRHARRQDEA